MPRHVRGPSGTEQLNRFTFELLNPSSLLAVTKS
jgi:hypothetical protein